MKKFLYAPIEVTACVIDDENKKQSHWHRWQANYLNLQHFSTPFPETGDNEYIPSQIPNGVYLQWKLPPGLLHGESKSTDSKSIESDEKLEFPALPNRWLVVRCVDTKKIEPSAWIVESDYVSEHPKDQYSTTFPDPTNQSLKQTYIGRKIELKDWDLTKQSPIKLDKLDAIANGDITFTAYQPYNQNVFSIHDDHNGIPPDAKLSYFVAGWYANEAQDILYQERPTLDTLKSLLQRYQFDTLNLLNDTDIPTGIICHGMVREVLLQNTTADLPTKNKLGFAVGRHEMEALGSLLKKDETTGTLWDEILKHADVSQFDEVDADIDSEHAQHQAGFRTSSGGDNWDKADINKIFEFRLVQSPKGKQFSNTTIYFYLKGKVFLAGIWKEEKKTHQEYKIESETPEVFKRIVEAIGKSNQNDVVPITLSQDEINALQSIDNFKQGIINSKQLPFTNNLPALKEQQEILNQQQFKLHHTQWQLYAEWWKLRYLQTNVISQRRYNLFVSKTKPASIDEPYTIYLYLDNNNLTYAVSQSNQSISYAIAIPMDQASVEAKFYNSIKNKLENGDGSPILLRPEEEEFIFSITSQQGYKPNDEKFKLLLTEFNSELENESARQNFEAFLQKLKQHYIHNYRHFILAWVPNYKEGDWFFYYPGGGPGNRPSYRHWVNEWQQRDRFQILQKLYQLIQNDKSLSVLEKHRDEILRTIISLFNIPEHKNSTIGKSMTLDEYIEKANAEIKKLVDKINEVQQEIETQKNKIIECSSSTDETAIPIQLTTAKPYYRPEDISILISGINSHLREEQPDVLMCRLESEVASEVKIDKADLEFINDISRKRSIPIEPIEKLLTEFYFYTKKLDPKILTGYLETFNQFKTYLLKAENPQSGPTSDDSPLLKLNIVYVYPENGKLQCEYGSSKFEITDHAIISRYNHAMENHTFDLDIVLQTGIKQMIAKWGKSKLAYSLPLYGLIPWKQPWQPLFFEWEVVWFDSSFDQWKFDRETGKYILNSDYNGDAKLYTGRTVLTPSTVFNAKAKIVKFLEKVDLQDFTEAEKQEFDLEKHKLLQKIQSMDILTLNLNGLYDKFLQRDHRTTRIPHDTIDDLSKLDRTLFGDQAHYAPMPGYLYEKNRSYFYPLAQGQLYLLKARLIDQFGRSIDIVDEDMLITTCSELQATPFMNRFNMGYKEGLTPPYIQIPPRISQELRLNIDWVDINDLNKTLDINEDSNPVFGWLLVNYLDKSLMVYSPIGEFLGELRKIEDDKKKVIWQPAPFSDILTITDLEKNHPQLANFLKPLETDNAISELFDVLDSAFMTVIQSHHHAVNYFSALIGRPLALTNTRMQLELAQPSYLDQTWFNTFKESKRDWPHFPIKIGDINLNKDGLIGYFHYDLEEGAYDFKHFFSPYPYKQGTYIQSQITDDKLKLIPTFQPQEFMRSVWLMDPLAKVHVYTEILPVYSMTLPPQFYDKALKQIEISFRIGPLLTPRYYPQLTSTPNVIESTSESDVKPLENTYVLNFDSEKWQLRYYEHPELEPKIIDISIIPGLSELLIDNDSFTNNKGSIEKIFNHYAGDLKIVAPAKSSAFSWFAKLNLVTDPDKWKNFSISQLDTHETESEEAAEMIDGWLSYTPRI